MLKLGPFGAAFSQGAMSRLSLGGVCSRPGELGGARWQRHISEANTVSHLLNIHICPPCQF